MKLSVIAYHNLSPIIIYVNAQRNQLLAKTWPTTFEM